MKICFITHSIFNLGGVQRVVSVLSNSLIEYHDITVLCLENQFPVNRDIYNLDKKVNIEMDVEIYKTNNLLKKILYKGIRYTHKRTNIKFSKNMMFNAYYNCDTSKLIEFINNNDFDIVIGVEGSWSIILSHIAKDISAKTIGWQHNSYDAYLNTPNKYYWKQDMIFKKSIPKLDKFIVLNEYDRKMYVQNMGIECDVIENPISFRSDLKSSVNNKNFLAAGRFTRQKGFDLLIKSFKEFSHENDDWTLTIVGEGEEEHIIRKMIKRYKLDNRVKVELFTNDIKKYFLNASALLLSSRWEGMPMVGLESLSLGVPIIAYDITGIHPLIENNKEGFIVEKFDTQKYAQAMLRIANDYEQRKEMSQNAIIKSKKFDIDIITNKWNKVFEDLNKNLERTINEEDINYKCCGY